MIFRIALYCMSLLCTVFCVSAQQPPNSEQPVAVSGVSIALDAQGNAALEASLRTTSLNGAVDTPVTNTRIVVKNVSRSFYSYVSGVATFYDSGGVRCGDGQFKTDVIAPSEAVEVDTPGIRITCSPTSWRIVATNLIPRNPAAIDASSPPMTTNLLISIDGEEHPIQLEKPMVLLLGNVRRTVIVKHRQNSN